MYMLIDRKQNIKPQTMFIEIETGIFFIALFVAADMSHFTWWAVASLVVHNIACIVTPARIIAPLLVSTLTISLLVSFTVVVLSAAECTLFAASLDENGPIVFTAGNWALHYWPSLRLLYRFWTTHRWTRSADNVALSIVPAQVLMLYCAINKPNVTYGCPAAISHPLFTLGGLAAAVGIERVVLHAVPA
mgnify:CR=1 FL=1